MLSSDRFVKRLSGVSEGLPMTGPCTTTEMNSLETRLVGDLTGVRKRPAAVSPGRWTEWRGCVRPKGPRKLVQRQPAIAKELSQVAGRA